MTNEHGLDVSYFKGKIMLIHRDANHYTPNEMARELMRLSIAASAEVIKEDEFTREIK